MWCAVELRGEPIQPRSEQRESILIKYTRHNAQLKHTPLAHIGSSRWQTSLYHISLVHLQILFLTTAYVLPIDQANDPVACLP